MAESSDSADYLLLCACAALSPGAVEQLVSGLVSDPINRRSRLSLLGALGAPRSERLKQLLWFAMNEPTASVGDHGLSAIASGDVEEPLSKEVAMAWRAAARASTDARVHANCARILMPFDPVEGARMLASGTEPDLLKGECLRLAKASAHLIDAIVMGFESEAVGHECLSMVAKCLRLVQADTWEVVFPLMCSLGRIVVAGSELQRLLRLATSTQVDLSVSSSPGELSESRARLCREVANAIDVVPSYVSVRRR